MRKFYVSARGRIRQGEPLYSGFRSVTRKSFGWIAVLVLLLSGTTSYASHLAGGELTYQWLGGTTYKFTATFYRDCAGITPSNTLALTCKSVSCDTTIGATMTLVAGTGQEITFPCPSANTTCTGGPNPGFQQWQYTATVNIRKRCSDWVFSWTSFARNGAITTIQNPGGAQMYIPATLNNLADTSASSPTFSNFPVAILCLGQSFSYNHGALDPNGDSLAYSFVCPRIDVNNCVTFINPYSATNPIASTPPAAINALSGDITMTPTAVQVGVTAVLVRKYHNGVLVGSVVRDMEFLTQNCGANNLPTASGINGTNIFGDTICAAAGAPICFNILSNDVDAGQAVTMTWNNGIPSASFIVGGGLHPTGTFCWQPTYANASSIPYTFTVTVRDNNCPANGVQVFSYFILVPPIIVTPGTANIACFGGTGSATAVGSGGISPYTYLWNPTGQVTATATGLVAGTTYTVTATDNHGCTNTNTIVLTQPSALAASISSSTNVSCNGANDGDATVDVSGGTGGYTHHWSDGQTTNPAVNLAAGNYTDTVKDGNGCSFLVNITITEPAVLSAIITSQQNASCQGLANGEITVTPFGGTAPYTYSWSPSVGTDSTVTGLAAGPYTVTVTDDHGCIATQSDTITEPGTLVPLITGLIVNGGNNISCYGVTDGEVSITVTGGTGPYEYLWSPGGFTTDTVTGLGAGTYTVHVTDFNLCTADTSITLIQPDTLIATIPDFSSYFGGVNISCNGANDGFINLDVIGGTPGYDFLWSPNGETTQSLDSLFAGTYSVTVTDANGCIATQDITLIEPDPLVVSEFSHSNVGCNGEASGSIVLTVSGGSGPRTYVWTPDVSSDSVATGLVAGTYTVDITDMNGCATSIIDTVSEPVTIFPLITAATVTGGLNIACSGDSTGTAWATVVGGTPPFSYLWSTGATTDTVTGLGAGPVSVHIVDFNGCSKDAYDTISQPEPVSAFALLSSYLGGANISCNGATDGSIELTVGGGTRGYTYLWSPNVSTDSVAFGLSAGIQYSVMITDTNGCKDSLFFTLTEPDSLLEVLSSPTTNGGWNISCNGATDGSITVDVFGGTGPYTYVWDPDVSNTSFASDLPAGTYTVTVTDTNFCSVTDSITLTEPEILLDTLTAKTYYGGKNISCYGYSDGSITDSVFGGTPPYTYLWSPGGETTQSLDLVPAGTYTVEITDANGCTSMDTITLTQPDSINTVGIISMYDVYNIACNGGMGCVDLIISGGTPGYNIFWITEDSTTHFCDTAGTYLVQVTDTLGCVSIREYTFAQPDAITIDAVDVSDFNGSGISCSGDTSSGFIHVSVSGGVPPYTHSWSNGYTIDGNLDDIGAGTYTDTITDANGCTTTVTETLTEPQPLTDSLDAAVYGGGYNVTCVGNDGCITVLANGGTRPYTYDWSPSVSTDSSSCGLVAGTYIITVTDVNGCSVIDSVTLIQSTTFDVTDTISDINGYGVSCNGSSDGFIHVSVTGGAPPYTHSWSNGYTIDGNLDNIPAGTYTDTITDVNGCKTLFTETITQSPLDTTSFTPATACDSLVLPWGGVAYTSSDYVFTYTNIFSCDSIVTAHVTINNSNSGTAPAVTACDSYVWNGTTYTTSGNQTHLFSGGNAAGCDSTATLPLTINYASSGTDAAVTACDSYVWNGATYTTSGSQTHLFAGGNALGCDSTATLPLTINYATSGTDAAVTACDSYVWNGATYTTSGSQTHLFAGGNALGCDSTATLPLTINSATSGTDAAVTACDSYIWNGTTYTASGSQTHLFTGGSADGCDSTATLPLTINYGTAGTDAAVTACDSYVWNGATYTSSGNQTYILSGGNAVGCDSTITLPLTINNSSSVNTFSAAACDSLTLPWGVTVSQTSDYSFTYTNILGCDSVVTIQLTITNKTSANGGADDSTCTSQIKDVRLNAKLIHADFAWWTAVAPASVIDSLDPVTGVSGLATGNNQFIWIVVDGPCISSDTVIVYLKTDADCFTGLEMPTGFTPNGDTHNDFFEIRGIDEYPGNTFKVYNRWGNEVFSMENYTNEAGHRWEGQNKSGDPLPDGTYFAILVLKSPSPAHDALHGYVDLRR